MQIEVNIISAFTKEGKGGNPAALVLNADRFSPQQKQSIASKIGLSETAFISTSAIADFKLDFFTPTRQIAHCGHATIASFSYLKQTGKISSDESSKETIDGRREIKFIGTEAFMEQKAPVFLSPETDDLPLVLHSVNLTAAEIIAEPIIVNTGNSFLIIQVNTEEVLQNLQPDFTLITALSEKYGLVGFYIFFRSLQQRIDATARMFAPAYGIEEESATGMAAGPLACFLYQFIDRKNSYAIEQGRFMYPSSPSLIKVHLELQKDKIHSLYAGGNAMLIRQMTLDIE